MAKNLGVDTIKPDVHLQRLAQADRRSERVYGYKRLIEEGTGRILGAHVVSPHADEVINLLGLAIRHGLTADDLKSTMFA